MTTIEDLVAAGAISRIEVELDGREQAQRLLYGTPGFIEWLGKLINGEESKATLDRRRQLNRSINSSIRISAARRLFTTDNSDIFAPKIMLYGN